MNKSSSVQFLGDVDTDRDSHLTPFSRHVSTRALAAVNALHSDGSQSPISSQQEQTRQAAMPPEPWTAASMKAIPASPASARTNIKSGLAMEGRAA
jgi:hypothetical protein